MTRRNRAPRAFAFASGLGAGAIIAVLFPIAQPRQLEAESMVARVRTEPIAPQSVAVMNTPPVVVASRPTKPIAGETDRRQTSATRTEPSRVHDGGVLRGQLVVVSRPQGAAVFINNEYAGETPLVARTMEIGSRAIRVRLDGYEPWSRGVRVVANTSTTVTAELTPAD